MILPDGSKDTIMRNGLNNILASRERDKKVQVINDMFHIYENFIISAGAKHKGDDSGCKCNEERRKKPCFNTLTLSSIRLSLEISMMTAL